MLEPELAETIERDHAALRALILGDAEPKKAMFSRRDDVVLANPLQPPVRGRRAVEDVLDGIGAAFRDGEHHGFERVADYSSGELAYVHEIERGRVGHAETGDELQPFALRVTQVWRREGGGWKIALRHADPTTAPRAFRDITA